VPPAPVVTVPALCHELHVQLEVPEPQQTRYCSEMTAPLSSWLLLLRAVNVAAPRQVELLTTELEPVTVADEDVAGAVVVVVGAVVVVVGATVVDVVDVGATVVEVVDVEVEVEVEVEATVVEVVDVAMGGPGTPTWVSTSSMTCS
jgi:hypothetical protein